MDVELGSGLILRLAGSDQGDGPSAELGRVGTGHDVQPSGEGSHLATSTGTFLVGQVKLSQSVQQTRTRSPHASYVWTDH